MKSRLPLYVSALVAAGSVSFAVAQPSQQSGAQSEQQPNAQSQSQSSAIGQPPAQPKGYSGPAPAPAANAAMSDANVPDARADVTSQAVSASGQKGAASPSMQFVQEPIATATKAQGADAQLADSIVKALDADPAMKDSKITVQPDKGTVFLTGATLTRAQKKRAGEIAIAQAGQGKVVNVILDDET